MPSGFYGPGEVASASPRAAKDSPLDQTEPRWEAEEPRDAYHREWGFYAFLYESEKSLLAGGLSSMSPIIIGGLTLTGPDVWSVPNLEMLDGVSVLTPAADTEDVLEKLCTAEVLLDSAFMQEFCSEAARQNGCLQVRIILPNLTATPDSDISGIIFPSGCIMALSILDKGSVWAAGVTYSRLRLSVSCPIGGTSKTCDEFFFDPPRSSGDNFSTGTPIRKNFSAAMSFALTCLKSEYGDCFEDLGCTCT